MHKVGNVNNTPQLLIMRAQHGGRQTHRCENIKLQGLWLKKTQITEHKPINLNPHCYYKYYIYYYIYYIIVSTNFRSKLNFFQYCSAIFSVCTQIFACLLLKFLQVYYSNSCRFTTQILTGLLLKFLHVYYSNSYRFTTQILTGLLLKYLQWQLLSVWS